MVLLVNCKESPPPAKKAASTCCVGNLLPSDLITDIMIRLPVKPLLRFRCVSKPICALIDSPYFINKHLNHSIKSKTNHNLIINASSRHEASIHSTNLYLPDLLVEIKHPFKTRTFHAQIMGSVNGLICLRTTLRDIVVLNPSTNKHLRIPPVFDHTVTHGFGYDYVSDDYKIFCFYPFLDRDAGCILRCKVAVYSLRSSSWEFLQDFPYHFRHYDPPGYGVAVCGRLHWLVKRTNVYDSPFLIAAFDLTTHSFSLVAHPNTLDKEFNKTDKNLTDMFIGELGGHLCVICNYCDQCVDAWVLKKYQVRESWIKLCSIPNSDRVWSSYYPFVYSKSGNEIMLLNEDMRPYWYDLEKEVLQKIEIENFPCGRLTMAVYLESLLPPNGM